MNAKIDDIEVSAYRVPTEFSESDGMLEWDSAMLVQVRARAPSEFGIGGSYTHARAAREAIGKSPQLFVDGNGAYSRKQALAKPCEFADMGVTRFEEPVSSDDLDGLRLLSERMPPQVEVAAGEYGYDPVYFRRMLESQSVDVLQADVTRRGITGFIEAAALCDSFKIPFSGHIAPTRHQRVCCALRPVRHIECFHDHTRIEQMFFDGAARAVAGHLQPDQSRPGLGIELKRKDVEQFRIQ